MSSRMPVSNPLKLEYPQSLAVYDEYAAAQKAVDFLSDNKFPVQQCMIVGTDLKRVERITGRLTWNRVAVGGALSGLWLGVFVGLVIAIFGSGNAVAQVASTALIGLFFGILWAIAGYAATRGQRDFSSVTQVVATKYEVLVEHKVAQAARDLLAQLPGRPPRPVRSRPVPAYAVSSVRMSDTTCPGCGLVLPETWSALDTRGYEASPECLELGGEVAAFGMLHPETLGRWRQTCVDAYAAQHVGPKMKPITICFALNGLFLVVERRWSGIATREAHAYLADTVPRRAWPRFTPPDDVGSLTVLDVALVSDPEDQAVAIEKWGTSVWEAWSHVHVEVRRMTDRQLKGWRPGQHS